MYNTRINVITVHVICKPKLGFKITQAIMYITIVLLCVMINSKLYNLKSIFFAFNALFNEWINLQSSTINGNYFYQHYPSY
jgi:hypothetical protein